MASQGWLLHHLGHSGLRIEGPTGSLCLDPPQPTKHPSVLTWSELERVQGVRESPQTPVAGPGPLLKWLGRSGTRLAAGQPKQFGAVEVTAWPYTPIPFATWAEALRKTRSALMNPRLAAVRLQHAFSRPKDGPVALRLRWPGFEVAYLHQGLHRFLSPAQSQEWVERAASADVVIAGTDYDDEPATGQLLSRMNAPVLVLADLTGPIRRRLGLPVRPLSACLAYAPERTQTLVAGQILLLQ